MTVPAHIAKAQVVVETSGRNIRLAGGAVNAPARERFYLVKIDANAEWRVDCGADRHDGYKGSYTVGQALAAEFICDEAKETIRRHTGVE